jgi:hypothetical protein
MLNYIGSGNRAYFKGLFQKLCGGLKKTWRNAGGEAASGLTIATHECVAYPAIAIRQTVEIFGRRNSLHFIGRKSTK